jgi:phytoene synthase
MAQDAGGPGTTLAASYAHCTSLVREQDPDRYYAALFAPTHLRPHLLALAAFSTEVARVREAISSAMPGEIRLQWWRDAIAGPDAGPTGPGSPTAGDVAAHPVAAALDDTVTRFRLPRSALLDLIDARVFDLYDDPFPTTGDLDGYLGETAGALIRLATFVLADGEDPGGGAAAGHAAMAVGITGLLRALPWHARRGQLFIPADVLDRHGVTRDDVVLGRGGPGFVAVLHDMRTLARSHLDRFRALADTVPPLLRPAFLPITLVPDYLAAMERPGYDPFRTAIDRAGWRKILTFWRASRRGF